MQKNERELCDAAVRLFEESLGTVRLDVSYPERDRSGPPVEMRVNLAGSRYAFEHTLIEPFPDAIGIGKEFAELTSPIVSELNGKLPAPGIYDLHFPIHPTKGRHRRTHQMLRKAIIGWVRSAAQELHTEAPERLDRNRMPFGNSGRRSTEIDGLPLTLHRRMHWSDSTRHDGVILLARVVGNGIEDRRRDRIRTALDRKLGKLAACAQEGDVTVLILEFADLALTNHVFVTEALEAELACRSDWPDHILLASTIPETEWFFCHPVRDGKLCSEIERFEMKWPVEAPGRANMPG
jgi:hypothetical protein